MIEARVEGKEEGKEKGKRERREKGSKQERMKEMKPRGVFLFYVFSCCLCGIIGARCHVINFPLFIQLTNEN